MDNSLKLLLRKMPEPLRWRWHRLRLRTMFLRQYGVKALLHWSKVELNVYLRQRFNRRHYNILTEEQLAAYRRSDTIFILGSGYSLNDITPKEWAHIGKHDVLGFSGAIYQKWISVNFHLLRGWDYGSRESLMRWYYSADRYARDLQANPLFINSVLLMFADYHNVFCNTLLGFKMIPAGSNIFLYKSSKSLDGLPSETLKKGIVHGVGTLCDAVNFAYLLGWKRIVLVGVDLYDSRYFWGRPDGTEVLDAAGKLASSEITNRGKRWDEAHNTVQNGIIELMGRWRKHFADGRGVSLEIYNSRSLLSKVIPVYSASQEQDQAGSLMSNLAES